MLLSVLSVLAALVLLDLESVTATASPGYPYDDDPYGHGHVNKVVDYYAKPKYAFGYEVDGLDPYYKELSHGRWEIRDGDVTQGQYRVLLPDGRIQIVSYIADKFGYRPTVEYINKGIHPPPPPAYAKVKIPKHHHHHHDYIQEPILAQPVPLPVPVAVPVAAPFPEQYGPGYGYSHGGHGGHFGGHFIDPFVALGSSHSGKKVARKRALLYDRTLFRKDVERKKRRTGAVRVRTVKRVVSGVNGGNNTIPIGVIGEKTN